MKMSTRRVQLKDTTRGSARMRGCAAITHVWLSNVNMSMCVCQPGGQPSGPTAWREWMDAREQLFHAAFTPPELFIWIAHVCLMHNLTASIDGSFKNTPPACDYICVSHVVTSRSHRHARPCGAWMRICQQERTPGFICVLHWDKCCFSKTSAEKQVQQCGPTLLVRTTNGSSQQADTL